MQLKKLEPWGAVALLLIYMFIKAFESVSLSADALLHKYGQAAIRHHLVFDYYKYYLIPQLTVVTVIAALLFILNFKLVPRQLQKNSYFLLGVSLILSFAVAFLVLQVCNTWLRYNLYAIYPTKQGADMQLVKESFAQTVLVFVLFIAYYLLKMLVVWLYINQFRDKPASKKIFVQLMLTAWLWVMLLSLAFISRDYFPGWLPYFILLLFPFYIALFFSLTYFFIPEYRKAAKRKKVIFATLLVIIVVGVPLFILFGNISGAHRNGQTFLSTFFFNVVLIVVTWLLSRVYVDQQKGRLQEIHSLQQTVSQKSAGIDFLRSQINPHFLFNALNTIYGTALQENADRTAEGVQKLGDMMRFMLQENQEEKIPLDKEINYLTNYIDLQRLRTLTSPDITIDLTIKDKDCRHYIAPMLLVPFVENAFKHGISLKEKSWIKINISCDTENLYFDVYNSVHFPKEDDPEKNRSGIGLENVKQRLSLLYPHQHELHIRSTNSEFFIHLTIRL